MSQPLTGQRPRAELIAELYDRHAAGLFAYCADQLGDPGTASDVLVSVLAGVPDAVPPRAALYAYARRQIRRRDVVYAPPVVDPLIDPASALVERTLRELRPHQREVLVLCAVCGLSMAELAWVLDVAPDTAEELAVGAGHRFRQVLGLALSALAGGRVPKPVADVYGALGVAPLRDVLGRLPWPEPPAILRVHFAGSLSADPGPMFVKPLWPAPPAWPLPLAESDPATSTGLFPAELLTPPSHPSVHEATTAPMPKLRDPLGALDTMGPLRDPASRAAAVRPFLPKPSQPDALAPNTPQPSGTRTPQSFGQPFSTGDVTVPPVPPRPSAPPAPLPPASPAAAPAARERPFFLSAPVPADVLDDEPTTQELPAIGDVLVHRGPEPRPLPGEQPVKAAAPLFTPRTRPSTTEPVYRMPTPEVSGQELDSGRGLESGRELASGRGSGLERELGRALERELARDVARGPAGGSGRDALRDQARDALRPREVPRPARRGAGAEPGGEKKPSVRKQPPVRTKNGARPGGGKKAAARKKAMKRRRERHYDWAWELVGFLICVAIAMIVFFSVPMFMGP